ncbi:MAG: hypothetical protein WCO03_01765 [bacterium]
MSVHSAVGSWLGRLGYRSDPHPTRNNEHEMFVLKVREKHSPSCSCCNPLHDKPYFVTAPTGYDMYCDSCGALFPYEYWLEDREVHATSMVEYLDRLGRARAQQEQEVA